ncbi:sulfotransferase family 2 domain-containing protein [Falsiroseomonas sp. E2-1-a4]|uniref:sulfotransferase family 2 domain-containing protein n=1 Tax=Falsiroseomonas sp. E2-1-a4 TaxID=3239299 RepID=UPI003F3D62A2
MSLVGPQIFGRSAKAFGTDPAVVRRRLGYCSFVSVRYRIVAVTVAKAACTTVKTALSALAPPGSAEAWPYSPDMPRDMRIHMAGAVGLPSLPSLPDTEAASLLDDPGVFRFTFVRNPFARLYSAWADKIRLGWEPQFQPVIRRMREGSGEGSGEGPGDEPSEAAPTGVSFARFLEIVCAEPPEDRDPHWARQVDIVFPGAIPYGLIGHVESMASDFADVAAAVAERGGSAAAFQPHRLNVSESGNWRQAYDARLAHMVSRAYAADFEAFGYDPNDWAPRPGDAAPDLARMLAARERLIVSLSGVLERSQARHLAAERLVGRAGDAEVRLRAAPTLAEAAPMLPDFAENLPPGVAEAVFELARADTPGIAVLARCPVPGLAIALAAGALSRTKPRPCAAVELAGLWVPSGPRRRFLMAVGLGGAADALRIVDMPVTDFAQINRQLVGVLVMDGQAGLDRLMAILAAFRERLAVGARLAILRGANDFTPPGFVACPAPEGLYVLRRTS